MLTMLEPLILPNHKIDDNFTYHPCNFNAVMIRQMFFVTEGHNFTLLQLTILEALHFNLMLYSDTRT